MNKKFTVGLVQMKCTTNKEENITRATENIREAGKRGAQVICLHELFSGEYFCRTEDAELFNQAEAIPGPTTERLSAVAKECKAALLVSLFERRAPGVYHNTCAVLDADGSYLGKYRKMHIPDDPLYYEKFYFTPGDLGFLNFDTKFARVGVQICWDQWYPEGSRLTAMQGADVIFYPTSIGWHPHEKAAVGAAQLDSWRTIQRALEALHVLGLIICRVVELDEEDRRRHKPSHFYSLTITTETGLGALRLPKLGRGRSGFGRTST